MKRILSCLTVFFFLWNIFLPGSVHAQNQDPIRATITELSNGNIVVEISEGDRAGQELQVLQFDEKQIENQGLHKGDQVLVNFIEGPGGREQVIIVDQFRLWPLAALFFLFLGVVVVIGRRKGFFSFLGMAFSFLIIAQMIVPQILLGNNPILISLVASLLVIPITFYISHGIKRKTTIAVISTFLALVFTAILAVVFVNLAKLTGYSAEEATFITAQQGDTINIQALLLAGIIIGAMGVLDDITISQTSIVSKLKKANPKFSRWELFRESMDVGHDHIASLVNTLVLVYVGASLPLFVLFSSSQFGTLSDVMNMEIVATEIVRTLVSSIGIVSAVPLTTLLAVWYIKD
ncbi:YibE/F family protein [Candidatus Roizmanbacteria bacterium]|nr:MAG: YibE/F family protein [Candidatus Roizmanbacteria bacterium]